MAVLITPTKSLALHAVDGMLAYENIMNGRRAFGEIVNEDNIIHILNNIGQIVEELRTGRVSSTYHIWPLLLRYTYQSPVIICAKHIPIVRYLQRQVPYILMQQDVGERIVEMLYATDEGKKWLTSFTFQGEIDKVWEMYRHDVIPVLIPNETQEKWTIADELRESLQNIAQKWFEEYFPDVYHYDEVSAIQQGKLYSYESKLLKSLLIACPEDLAMMYLTYFFPNVIKKLLGIVTLYQFESVALFSLLDRHVYELLQLGMPALYKVFGRKYPDTIPEIEFKLEDIRKRGRG